MFPRLLDIGPIHIASYGFFVAAGYLAGILWLKRNRERMQMTEDQFWTVIYSVFVGAVVGGKLMFFLLEWRQFSSGQLSLIRDFRYGFVFYGGVIGSLVAGILAAWRLKIPFAPAVDYFAVVAPLGQAIGRLGCLAAGCCYGAPTTLPWGITFRSRDSLVPDTLLGVSLHPAQLYEAGGNVLVGWAVWRVLRREQEGHAQPGSAYIAYLCLYGLNRFLVEFTRADERGAFVLGLSPAQWTALILSAGALTWVAVRRSGARAAA